MKNYFKMKSINLQDKKTKNIIMGFLLILIFSSFATAAKQEVFILWPAFFHDRRLRFIPEAQAGRYEGWFGDMLFRNAWLDNMWKKS